MPFWAGISRSAPGSLIRGPPSGGATGLSLLPRIAGIFPSLPVHRLPFVSGLINILSEGARATESCTTNTMTVRRKT